ncbi:colipase-like [Discoglossus pictus]
MKIMLPIISLLLIVGLPSAEQSEAGFPFHLDPGDLCLQSPQCKSNCCRRKYGLSLSRCAPKAKESEECSPLHLYGVYYYCPCESGLVCEVDRTNVETITNTDFGYCVDPNDKKNLKMS